MNKLWWFIPRLPDEPGLERMGEYVGFANDEELVRIRLAMRERAPSNFPTARLQIALQTFSLDCFLWPAYTPEKGQQVFTFVSRHMRDAMALGPRDVQYLPVDSSLSAPLPHSKEYMIMHVPGVETVSDPDRSVYEIRNIVGLPKGIKFTSRIAIRQDVKLEHEIFRDSFFNRIFCTDELVTRILQQRCSGVRFFDPDYLDYPMRFRSGRGIEEETWDPVQEKPLTRLLQAAPLHLTTVNTDPPTAAAASRPSRDR